MNEDVKTWRAILQVLTVVTFLIVYHIVYTRLLYEATGGCPIARMLMTPVEIRALHNRGFWVVIVWGVAAVIIDKIVTTLILNKKNEKRRRKKRRKSRRNT